MLSHPSRNRDATGHLWTAAHLAAGWDEKQRQARVKQRKDEFWLGHTPTATAAIEGLAQTTRLKPMISA
jgi:hypothetical protein